MRLLVRFMLEQYHSLGFLRGIWMITGDIPNKLICSSYSSTMSPLEEF
jgi:hypothetical protein